MNLVFAQPVGRDLPNGVMRTRQSLVPVVGYVAGTVAGSAALGAALFGCRVILDLSGSYAVVGAAMALSIIAIWGAFSEIRQKECRVPQRCSQVPRGWLSWGRPTQTAAAFGFMLGGIVFTYLNYAAAYLLFALLLLAPSLPVALLVAGSYGLTRASVLVVAWWDGISDAGAIRRRPFNQVVRTVQTVLPCIAVLGAAVVLIALAL